MTIKFCEELLVPLREVELFVKVQDVIRLIEEDGWRLIRTVGSHRQFKHPSKEGLVTVAGKRSLDVPPGTLRSILKQSGLKSG